MKNAHLPFDALMALSKAEGPFDALMALSKAEGLCYPHSSSLRRTSMYASLLGISGALHMDVFDQPAEQFSCCVLCSDCSSWNLDGGG